MYDLIELQRKLRENIELRENSKLQESRNEAVVHPTTVPSNYRIHMAAVDDASKLLQQGYTSRWVSYVLGIPISVVEVKRAGMERQAKMRQKYTATGNLDLPGQMAGVSILQG
jgi:hypothetical protein